MSYYYSVPWRVQAAQWRKDDLNGQARVVELILGAGLVENVTLSIESHILHVGDGNGDILTVHNNNWVVCDGGSVEAMDDGVFRSTYVQDPRSAADEMVDGGGEGPPNEDDDEDPGEES
ncbi:hypothetical protein N2384_19930 [Bacillus paralicheniformis]|uniref:hypothetical protein n=1 Tax=Bacillus paralicheniformis TaxID=1648923 RepID=UPI0021A4EB66|nr:hypothetical protein [Bacillus paralicheniformis]UWS60244.1 hypothetical protein N2384_19930 [Bacillus paralicheniformis]